MIQYLLFLLLLAVIVAAMHLVLKVKAMSTVSSNPNFVKFQNTYLAAYLTALFADWLQIPYQYKLYSYYGFEEEQIAVLYVCGFASTVVLGSWAPVVADRFGRKKLCIVFTLIYSVASLVTLSRSYFVLIVGRILGGVATSVLFSAFQSWYLHEHTETYDFPKEWIQESFQKVDSWSGLLAIAAGLVANSLAGWMGLGPVSPFILAVPVLLISGVLISSLWTENCSPVRPKIRKSCMDGLHEILKDPMIFLTGIVQSLFESTMYIFVFIWTPVLDKYHVPLGIVFSCFMASAILGSNAFVLLNRWKLSAATLLALSVILSAFGNIVAAFAAKSGTPHHVLAFIAFLIIEFSVGIYFRAMTVVRTRVVPHATCNSINSWFRVPLNLIACAILMCLHNDAFRHGNRLIFVLCTVLLLIASIFVIRLVSLVRHDDEFSDIANPNTDADVNNEKNTNVV